MGKVRSVVESLRDAQALRGRVADLERELQRVSPQLAALEERVEQLSRRLDDAARGAGDGEAAEAAGVLEEVRAEHARVRARITAATVFEERLRVLESHLGVDSATGRIRSD